jgi:predicted dehydrogenase
MTRRHFLQTTAALTLPHFARAAETERIRIAQIGTAHSHAAGKMEALRALPEIYEVVGIAEPDEKRRAAAAKTPAFADLPWLTERELLDTPGLRAVAIETGIADAPDAALRALRAGKHIHLDKPGSLTHAPFKAMREEAARLGLTVQMGYMLRYNPAFELLFRAAREDWLGDITEIDASMGKLAEAGLRAELRALPGAGMFELACHLVDATVTLLGKPTAVHAFAKATRAPDDPLPDNQLAILEYPRATVTLRCNHADPFGGPHRRFAVTGTKGAMEILPLESGKATLSLTESHDIYVKGPQTLALKVPADRYVGEFRDLTRVIRGEKALAWDAAHDIAAHETALRAAGAWPLTEPHP